MTKQTYIWVSLALILLMFCATGYAIAKTDAVTPPLDASPMARSISSFDPGGTPAEPTNPTEVTGLVDLDSDDDVMSGSSVNLWANVKNNLATTLTADYELWFWVGISDGSDGYSWNRWLGPVSVEGLENGTVGDKVHYDWDIPQNLKTAEYELWAIIYQMSGPTYTEKSEWAQGDNFNLVTAKREAEVVSVGDITPTRALLGEGTVLTAEVKSTGNVKIDNGCELWFWVEGTERPTRSYKKWVGYTQCIDLPFTPEDPSGSIPRRYSFSWDISEDMKVGRYDYGARVFYHPNKAYSIISDYSSEEAEIIIDIQRDSRVLELGEVDKAVAAYPVILSARVEMSEDVLLCSDGIDNDADGCFDGTDSDCGGEETSCTDGVDNDCDGQIDCDDSDCEGNAACETTTTIPLIEAGLCDDEIDNDQDGDTDCEDPDCDSDPACSGGGPAFSTRHITLSFGKVSLAGATNENTDNETRPKCIARFWVETYGWVGNSTLDVTDAKTEWYNYSWMIPSDAKFNNYDYYARVYCLDSNGEEYIPASDWSGVKAFDIIGPEREAEILSVGEIDIASGTANLTAEVKNTGYVEIDSGCEVWFWVEGIESNTNSFGKWIGYTECNDLPFSRDSPDGSEPKTYSFTWTIPTDIKVGTYKYGAKVYYKPTEITAYSAISEYSSEEDFGVVPEGLGCDDVGIENAYASKQKSGKKDHATGFTFNVRNSMPFALSGLEITVTAKDYESCKDDDVSKSFSGGTLATDATKDFPHLNYCDEKDNREIKFDIVLDADELEWLGLSGCEYTATCPDADGSSCTVS